MMIVRKSSGWRVLVACAVTTLMLLFPGAPAGAKAVFVGACRVTASITYGTGATPTSLSLDTSARIVVTTNSQPDCVYVDDGSLVMMSSFHMDITGFGAIEGPCGVGTWTARGVVTTMSNSWLGTLVVVNAGQAADLSFVSDSATFSVTGQLVAGGACTSGYLGALVVEDPEIEG